MAEEAKWYVVHTYSGYENAVAAAVMKAAENRKMQDLIQEVNIPMETVTEHTDAGEKTYERKVFPGYVLVKMIMTDESWHLVRNVRGATGFVGTSNKAIPLTDQEIYDLGVERHEVVLGYEVGDTVNFNFLITDISYPCPGTEYIPQIAWTGTKEAMDTNPSSWGRLMLRRDTARRRMGNRWR